MDGIYFYDPNEPKEGEKPEEKKKKNNSYETAAQTILSIERIIGNLNGEEITGLLEGCGFGAKEIAEIQKMLKKAKKTQTKYERARADQKESHRSFLDQKGDLNQKFTRNRNLLITVFTDNRHAIDELGLQKQPPTAFAGWIQGVEKMYDNLHDNSDYLKTAKKRNITVDDVKDAIQLIDEVKQKEHMHKKMKSQSEDLAKERDVAFRELKKWRRNFFRIAKVAFIDHPQYLEAFGRVVKYLESARVNYVLTIY